MKNTIAQNDPGQFAAFVAVDWADEKHAFTIQAAGQKGKESGILQQKAEEIGTWVASLRERFGGRTVAVAVEQSRGALIHALLSYDFLVIYPIHPTTVAKFREAFKSSGVKDDPLDTEQILEILTKHIDQLKPLCPDTEETRLLARLVEDRRKAVGLRASHIQALKASLKEYFPQALEVLSNNVTSRLAYDFIKKWPTFVEFQHAKPSTIKEFFYGHNVRSPEAIEEAQQVALKSRPLTTDTAIVQSGVCLSRVHAELIHALNPVIDQYEKKIEAVLASHPEAKLFDGVPGAGPALQPRLTAAFGTDRSRFGSAHDMASFSGIAPVTRRSGKMWVVYARCACPKFLRQTFHELALHSLPTCQWASNYVEYYTSRGKPYHVVIRALAFKWIRILFACWKNRIPYDDQKYLKTLEQRGSIFATLHLKKN